MKYLLILSLPALLTACAVSPKAPLPPRAKPTRIVNRHYSADRVRFYETYRLARQRRYNIPGYRIVFVHLKNGAAYPVPCMPSGDGLRPTLAPTVYANPQNDAWTVYTYLPRRADGAYEFTHADLARDPDGLYLGGQKLKETPNLPLKD